MMDGSIKSQFGKRIQTLRKQLGLSQERFSLKIEMDRTYYASVENGKRNISLENIKKIADGFNISISKLFEEI
ncbi:MAG: helix-turn-helix transcriptional regulator [Spirochaetaceae bacterium]|nr:helix-turn-helix transcriptional regulator [Spirochaetaceae bacterium]